MAKAQKKAAKKAAKKKPAKKAATKRKSKKAPKLLEQLSLTQAWERGDSVPCAPDESEQ